MPDLTSAWWDEIDRFEADEDQWETASSADLADELDAYRALADADPHFDRQCAEWHEYVLEKQIWLALEQSCYQGVLLPPEQRALRLATCPHELLSATRWFFELCPVHVQHHIALFYYVLVRIDRARRRGAADWKASDTHTPEPEPLLFRWGAKHCPRRYTG